MRVHDSLILFTSGLAIWTVGTIFYAYRGRAVLESTSRYWISLCISAVVSTALCIMLLRWRQVPSPAWASGTLLIALPGMIGEAIVLSHFSAFMPGLQEISAGRYGASLFASYAVALGIAEAVTLKATP
jgi:hypothetical protein